MMFAYLCWFPWTF